MNERQSCNIIRMPYAVAHRRVIQKLIDVGYLQRNRLDATAVEAALRELRKRSAQFLRKFDEGTDSA
jgi:hypothetical protein